MFSPRVTFGHVSLFARVTRESTVPSTLIVLKKDKMPKTKSNLGSSIIQWVEPYNRDKTVFTTSGLVIYCQVCDRQVRCNKKFQITQHVSTEFHLKCLKKSSNNTTKQMLLGDEAKPKTSSFNKDLCLSLVAANIPWLKLQNPLFRNFLQTYTKKHIPDESTLRKSFLHPCYVKTIEKIREQIGDSYIYLVVDETTDINGSYIANLLVGVLNEQNPSKPFLISCKKLDKTNHSTISRFVNDSLRILWPHGGNDEKVLLLCSDAAPYMIKAGKTLNVFFPNLIHITCLAHMIHRLAEKVRELYPNVNTLVGNLKKVFLKAPQRVDVYKEIMPSVPLPPEPVLTRWGTWIEAANFCADHFDDLKIIFQKLEDKTVVSIRKCINMLSLESVKSDLAFIQSHFFILVKSIKKLEHCSLTLCDSTQIVNNVILAMEKVPGQKGKTIQEKMQYLIEKNIGFQIMKQITAILSGKENSIIPSNLTPSMCSCMKFAPITSVDVERSFSTYKSILTEKRTSITPENMEKYIIVHCYENY